jgi:hypothetical protein
VTIKLDRPVRDYLLAGCRIGAVPMTEYAAELDLLREFDKRLKWDEFRTRQLVRERPEGRPQ